jgi:23S rRNA pseudouridine2605 synthase
MARRRSFSKDDHRSNARSKSHGPRPGGGSGPRSNSPGVHRQDQRHSRPGAASAPRGNARSASDVPGKLERVQKILAHAGLGSRRACEELIVQGRVSIDGEAVKQLGTRVDPARAKITVDGEPIRLESMVYYAVNKPRGYVSTNFDPSGRPRVVDLLPEIPERVYTVGRLDEDSTGLMILTNDGELANRLAHPRYGVEKLYRALVAGLPSPEMLAKLTEGIWLSDGKVRAKRARIVGRQGEATRLELVLAEGKKREIRRMLSKLGHKVMALNRVAVGPVSLKGLSAGQCRPLSRHEIDLLRKVASGISISLPRFFDEGTSTRPPRDSHRPHKTERDRSARDASSPPGEDHKAERGIPPRGGGGPVREHHKSEREHPPRGGGGPVREHHKSEREHPPRGGGGPAREHHKSGREHPPRGGGGPGREHHKSEREHPPRVAGGPVRERPRRPTGATDSSKRPRPLRPHHAGPNTPDRPISRTPHDQKEGPAGRPPKPKLPSRPSSHSRPEATSKPLATPAQPTRRRIIGLEPEPTSGPLPNSTGGRGRKRIASRKPRLTPPPARKKPNGPTESPGDDDQ